MSCLSSKRQSLARTTLFLRGLTQHWPEADVQCSVRQMPRHFRVSHILRYIKVRGVCTGLQAQAEVQKVIDAASLPSATCDAVTAKSTLFLLRQTLFEERLALWQVAKERAQAQEARDSASSLRSIRQSSVLRGRGGQCGRCCRGPTERWPAAVMRILASIARLA